MPAAKPGLSRDEKVENLVLNFSMIMMGMFEGVFAALAAGMTTALEKTADALVEALDSKEASKKPPGHVKLATESEVNTKVKEVFSGLRKEVAEGFANRDSSFKKFIRDPAFDEGVKIVERHKLKLPPLTGPLSDDQLAAYVNLIQNEDPETAKMMQELGEWQKSTPQFTKRKGRSSD